MEKMKFTKYVVSAFMILMSAFSSSHAYTFYAGGKDGWIINPRESYNHWAERNRFQVNDTIVFKYKKGSDSVLVVHKDDFQECNKVNPMQTMKDGDSIFKFERSGPFFFISGHGDKCEKGQKLVIVVMAVRNKAPHNPVITPSSSPSSAMPSPIVPQPADDNRPLVLDAPAPAPSSAPPSVGGGSMVVLMLGMYGLFLSEFVSLI